ncbi:MAG: AMP-binding protein [Acetobacteraceae bacterium]
MDTPAREAAEAQGVPVVELVPDADGPAGSFTLAAAPAWPGPAAQPGLAGAEDVALVLHASGTTSRPKIVPLRHVNVTASAARWRDLALTPDDVCLNIMPLFHIHGLIARHAVEHRRRRTVSCSTGFPRLPLLPVVRGLRPT